MKAQLVKVDSDGIPSSLSLTVTFSVLTGMERQVLDRHHMFAAANAGAPLTEPPPIGATLCDIEMGSTTKQFILTTEVSMVK